MYACAPADDHSAKVQFWGVWIPARSDLEVRRVLLVEAPPHWPPLELARVARRRRRSRSEVTADQARLWLAGGALGRTSIAPPLRADLRAARGRRHDGALVHPYLAPVALVMARWLGREGFHGGGIVAGGGVWAVLGDKTAGKSTTLAWLARAGVGVVSDDVPDRRRRDRARRAALDRPARGGRAAPRHGRADGPCRRARALAAPADAGPGRAAAAGLDHARVGRRGRGRADPRRRAAAPRCCRTAACGSPRPTRARWCASARCRTCGSSARATGTHCRDAPTGCSTRSPADASQAACRSVSECGSGARRAQCARSACGVDELVRDRRARPIARQRAGMLVEEQRVEAGLGAPRDELRRQQRAPRPRRARRPRRANPARGAASRDRAPTARGRAAGGRSRRRRRRRAGRARRSRPPCSACRARTPSARARSTAAPPTRRRRRAGAAPGARARSHGKSIGSRRASTARRSANGASASSAAAPADAERARGAPQLVAADRRSAASRRAASSSIGMWKWALNGHSSPWRASARRAYGPTASSSSSISIRTQSSSPSGGPPVPATRTRATAARRARGS